jgi:hypothetical protein
MLDDIARNAEKQADLIADKRVLEFLSTLERARADISLALLDTTEWDRARLIRLMKEIDRINIECEKRLRAIKPVNTDTAKLAAETSGNIIAILDSAPDYKIAFGRLETNILQAFADATLDKVTGDVSAHINTIKVAIFNKIGVQGNNSTQVAKELLSENSVFTGKYAHVETIIRTETSTIYNEQSLESLRVSNDGRKNPFKKRIVETLDKNRNHPISRVLRGQVKPVDEPFTATVAEIEAAAKAIGKKSGYLSGILWSLNGSTYSGMNLPAHYRERGVIVPNR